MGVAEGVGVCGSGRGSESLWEWQRELELWEWQKE